MLQYERNFSSDGVQLMTPKNSLWSSEHKLLVREFGCGCYWRLISFKTVCLFTLLTWRRGKDIVRG